jgi:hypothetical protein
MTTTNWLVLFGEIIAVYTENHTKHTNTLCGHNTEVLNVKGDGTYSYHWALKNEDLQLQGITEKLIISSEDSFLCD